MEHAGAPAGRDPLATAGKLLGLAIALVVLGYCGWFLTLPEGGVQLGNQIDDRALEYLEEHGILNGTESLVAYYDVTVRMSGEESAILTSERVIYHKAPRTTAVALADIEELRHRTEPLIGDVIEIASSDGQHMQIEIAPLNNGRTFWNALRRVAPAGIAVHEDAPPAGRTPEAGKEARTPPADAS